MRNKQSIRKWKRVELLELLVEQSKELDRLRLELAETKENLHKKEILLQNAGSIAEAAMQLNHIFSVAQETADQYLENIKRMEAEARQTLQNTTKDTAIDCPSAAQTSAKEDVLCG